MQRIRVFAASPADVANERAKVQTVASLLKPLADSLDIDIEVVDWRRVVPDMGRPEQVILDQLAPTAWDVFVGILWHRFGTPPGASHPATGAEYQGGTEEEFRTAYALWQRFGKPRIMMYRCTRDIPQDALDPDQLAKVRAFFSQFDARTGAHPGLYQPFDTTDSFEKLLLGNLQQLLVNLGEQVKGAPLSKAVVEALAPRPPDNLPRRAAFFGREKELEAVLRALSPDDRSWGILVDGIGGIGKSALALEAAYRSKEQQLFDAFVLVTAKPDVLTPVGIRALTPAAGTLDEFLNETARVLGEVGIAQLPGTTKRRAILEALRSTRALLVYDNLETLTREEQEAMASFLRDLPQGSKSIITSRRRGGEGAVWLRLEQLEWPAAREIIRNEMGRDAQLKLKLERSGESRWTELHDETRGSPLALVHVLGLMRARASLTFDGALQLLRGNRVDDLQAFIFREASRELTPNDRTALGALSYFASSASFEAWMAVSGLTRNALENTIDRLTGLSLVDSMAGQDRYAIHPLTRNFVRDELLEDAAVVRTIGLRFVTHWRGQAIESGASRLAMFEIEWPNIDAAAEWLWQTAGVHESQVADREAAATLGQLVTAFYRFMFDSGRWDDLIRLNMRACNALRASDDPRAASLHAYHVAFLHMVRDEPEAAEPWAAICADEWGNRTTERPLILTLRADLANSRGQEALARQLYDEVLAIAEGSSDKWMASFTFDSAAEFEMLHKRYEVAERWIRKSLELSEPLDDRRLMEAAYVRMGQVCIERQRWDEAEPWLNKALSLTTRQDYIGTIKYCLARVHGARGELMMARALATEALAMSQKLRTRIVPHIKAFLATLEEPGED